ncbi:MAG: DUF1848 domain-containing protein [Clostridia bacterium]|nr:DUF1848 domain-containing protein [Clostridia bacterium]
MIIQTGMRTDIPAFYSDWLANRLRAGYVLVRNPYNPTAVTRYRLSPDVVDGIAFCTKNPAPMLKYMPLLEPYGQYWFVTITPYGPDIEPNVPPKSEVVESFRRLSAVVGPDAVGWRCDPILVSHEWTVARHIAAFEETAAALAGYTHTCVISFIDLYEKVKRNFPEARRVSRADREAIGRAFAEVGARHGMTIRACAEGDELAPFGVDCGGCMRVEDYERALGCRLRVPKVKSIRPACACVLGSDIGAYNTCGHLCRYCYANADAAAVRANMRAHDPESPFLLGGPTPDDVIHPAQQASWKDMQLRMEI